MHHLIQHRAELLPVEIGRRVVKYFVHGLGFLFMGVPAAFRPHGFGGGEMRAGVKPAGQDRTMRQDRRFAREVGKNCLRHVLRQVRVAVDLSQVGRIDEVQMPPHQLGKGVFGFHLRIAAEQFAVAIHRQPIAPGEEKTGQENCAVEARQSLRT